MADSSSNVSRKPVRRSVSQQEELGPKTPPTGLGIDGITIERSSIERPHAYRTRTDRTPSESKYSLIDGQSGPHWPLGSPPSSGRLTGTTFQDGEEDAFLGRGVKLGHRHKSSSISLQPSEGFDQQKSMTASVRERYEEWSPRHICTSSRHFKKNMCNWLALLIILLSVFSTTFSCIFLGIGLRGPRYGRTIGTDGSLTISNAAFVTSLFAKLIELSFVTVVVVFLGQCLARRAYMKERYPGVTLAEINMRNWVAQPGTLFTNWESVRYAGLSTLGCLAVIAAVIGTFYTSAATALVQPQLRFSNWEKFVMQGLVKTSFANTLYIQENCKTPIVPPLMDDEADAQGTCIQIEHASQAYHNYQHWIGEWAEYVSAGNGSAELAKRPPGWALFDDNTTISAPWIEESPVRTYGPKYWTINNVTLAFPHTGVVAAAQDKENNIMQPNELSGLGIYTVRASVPSPWVNVICALGLDNTDLKQLVYSEWPRARLQADGSVDMKSWPQQLSHYNYSVPYLGGTAFDEIFEWGEEYGAANVPPIFPFLPIDYNTIANDTTNATTYGRQTIYILGKGGPVYGAHVDDNYSLCQMRVGLTPYCHTEYTASSNVATLSAVCNETHDDMRYDKSQIDAPKYFSPEWPNIASMWIRSINMNSGFVNGNASNARLWTQLTNNNTFVDWQGNSSLNTALPSPAEALAVMSGCTLLQSAQDAPFVMFFNFTSYNGVLDPPQRQVFNASVHQQQYASGGTPGFERIFHVVLFAVFLINLFILAYWIWRREWYTDFSDPTNLFALAINSPPSEKLAECSCGLGNSERYRHRWHVGTEHSGHIILSEADTQIASPGRRYRLGLKGYGLLHTPVSKSTDKDRMSRG